MTPLKDIRLTPRDASLNYFTMGKMTISLDVSGDPVVIDNLEALEQDVLKAAFTGVQPDGYGTVISRVIGEKNLNVVKAMISFTIISSMQVLVRIHDAIRRANPLTFRGVRCLQWVDYVYVRAITTTSIAINVDYRTRENDSRTSVVQYSIKE